MDSKWKVKFSYSRSGKVNYLIKEFSTDNIDRTIKDYLAEQNKGEAKSDKIKYRSKINESRTADRMDSKTTK